MADTKEIKTTLRSCATMDWAIKEINAAEDRANNYTDNAVRAAEKSIQKKITSLERKVRDRPERTREPSPEPLAPQPGEMLEIPTHDAVDERHRLEELKAKAGIGRRRNTVVIATRAQFAQPQDNGVVDETNDEQHAREVYEREANQYIVIVPNIKPGISGPAGRTQERRRALRVLQDCKTGIFDSHIDKITTSNPARRGKNQTKTCTVWVVMNSKEVAAELLRIVEADTAQGPKPIRRPLSWKDRQINTAMYNHMRSLIETDPSQYYRIVKEGAIITEITGEPRFKTQGYNPRSGGDRHRGNKRKRRVSSSAESSNSDTSLARDDDEDLDEMSDSENSQGSRRSSVTTPHAASGHNSGASHHTQRNHLAAKRSKLQAPKPPKQQAPNNSNTMELTPELLNKVERYFQETGQPFRSVDTTKTGTAATSSGLSHQPGASKAAELNGNENHQN
jgi:hypothetical protein